MCRIFLLTFWFSLFLFCSSFLYFGYFHALGFCLMKLVVVFVVHLLYVILSKHSSNHCMSVCALSLVCLSIYNKPTKFFISETSINTNILLGSEYFMAFSLSWAWSRNYIYTQRGRVLGIFFPYEDLVALNTGCVWNRDGYYWVPLII